MRYDGTKQLCAKIAADIAEVTTCAEPADAKSQIDPQGLPTEIARRGNQGQAGCRPRQAREAGPHRGEAGRQRGRLPEPREDDPPPARQSSENPGRQLKSESLVEPHSAAFCRYGRDRSAPPRREPTCVAGAVPGPEV